MNYVLLILAIAEAVLLSWGYSKFGPMGLLIAPLATVAWYRLSVSLFGDARRPDQEYHIRAADGWDLTVWRIKPAAGVPRMKTPVLLVHGLSANQRGLDLDDRNSLARFLARDGYDCFVPALRGNGVSQYPTRRSNKWRIRFDDYVEKDVPAFLDLIQSETGAEKIHFVGQSMGAMVGYAVGQGDQTARLASITAMAGPCFFQHMDHFKKVARLRGILERLPFAPLGTIGTMQAPLARLWPRLLGRTEVNPDNVDGDVLARAAVNLVDNTASSIFLQFAQWVNDGEFGSHRPVSWEKGLGKITVPIFCMGSSKDFFCPPGANRDVIDHVGSEIKRYRFFSTANGDRSDYGHGDLWVGRTAPDEVYPAVREWLREIDEEVAADLVVGI